MKKRRATAIAIAFGFTISIALGFAYHFGLVKFDGKQPYLRKGQKWESCLGNDCGNFTTTLELSNVDTSLQPVFKSAAARWERVIVGDLQDAAVDSSVRMRSDCKNLPSVIDDVFICAAVETIDGPSGILGFAGPEFLRIGGNDHYLPVIGKMKFDRDDVDGLARDGRFQSVILHEMGHVYGIGTLWKFLGLTSDTASCPYKLNSAASREYQAFSGCRSAVPTETDGGQGTACGHWDEACFRSELMTGIATGALQLSRVTVGGLEDIGYQVNYNQADPYSRSMMHASCKCRRGLGVTGKTRYVDQQVLNQRDQSTSGLGPLNLSMRRKLSEKGRQRAIEYGRKHLDTMSKQKETMPEESQYKYIGDLFVSILYAEEGEIFAVEVWGDERRL